MARIDVQKKKRSVWPWVMIVLLLAVLGWFFVEGIDQKEEISEIEPLTEGEVLMPSPYEEETPDLTMDRSEEMQREKLARDQNVMNEIDEFANFVEGEEMEFQMGRDHEYTSEGLTRLASALSAIVEQETGDFNLQRSKETLQEKANQLQVEPMSEQHADLTREAFLSAANLINSIQDKHYPSLNQQVADLVNTAEQIDPDEQLLNQREQVKSFFEKSRQTLQAMAETNE